MLFLSGNVVIMHVASRAPSTRFLRQVHETAASAIRREDCKISESRSVLGGLDRRGTPHGFLRRALRRFIHFFSYHLILSRQTIRGTRAAGFRLTVRPTVFHPRFFISSECFAEFIGRLELGGKRVVDVGTGSGILALAAARAGAENTLAVDINPNAALTAAENARANGMGERVTAVCSNLLSAFAPRPLFDVILSSPPKHAGEPRDLADRGWHAGPNYRDIAALFEQARPRLRAGGRLYIMLSSDSDLDLFGTLIDRAGFRARLVHERSIFIESLIIYELTAV
jgi:release factor glutamine methyltransferase